MNGNFCAELIGCSISNNYVNPGESLFLTLRMRNCGTSIAPENYRFVMDMRLGHQRKIENKQYNYRVTCGALPGTSQWTAGMETEVTLRWEVTPGWSGTYHLVCGMLDENDMPVSFYVEGAGEVRSFEIGAVEVSWNMGRPWVFDHRKSVETIFAKDKNTTKYIPSQNPDTITLTDDINVVLSRSNPCFLSIDGTAPLFAEPEVLLKYMPTGEILTASSRLNKNAKCSLQFSLQIHSNNRAHYMGLLRYDGEFAAAFLLQMELSGRVLTVKVAERNERPDYELLSVKYPSMVELDGGYLLDFYGGGRLVNVENATPIFFNKPYDVRNAAVLYNNQRMFIVESTHIDSILSTGVLSVNSQKRGVVGGKIVCRIPAAGSLAGIPISRPPIFTIESCLVDEKNNDWIAAAKLLRRGVKPNNARDLYRNAYLYKQLSTWGPLPDEKYRKSDKYPTTQNLFRTVTFKEIAENVRGFSNLTDNVKQIMYIAGFQKYGFDDGYPYPYDTDERCGSLKDLGDSLIEMRKYNTVSGLHDNFDDVSFRYLNEFPYVAMDKHGNPWHGWVWPAGPTFSTAFVPYVESGGVAERINKMCKILPLAESYHIDVLTAETCRYDFNPECPAGADDSFRAKLKVVAEWAKYGIDITSEMLSHPSVGHIGFALHTRMDTKEVFIPGDTFVPLVNMIYHGIIGYTAPSMSVEEMLWGLLVGAQIFHEVDITGETCISRHYIQNIPAMKLYDKFMTNFVHINEKARADYGDNSYVEADFLEGTYKVVVDGQLIGQNFSTFVPAQTKGAYLAYSFKDTAHMYKKPAEISNGATLRAVILTKDGEGAALENAVIIEGDNIILRIPSMTPVKIYF